MNATFSCGGLACGELDYCDGTSFPCSPVFKRAVVAHAGTQGIISVESLEPRGGYSVMGGCIECFWGFGQLRIEGQFSQATFPR